MSDTACMKVTGLFRSATDTKSVDAGTVIFEEGSTGDLMYGIVEGEVELRRGGAVVAKLTVDDVFGEMAVVDASPRMATAVATTDAVLAVIDHRRFLFHVHETPTFALQVMSTMAARLRAQH
jgi:CRP/FNR family cyclic AMP-dependent transcriptional regulator